MILICTNELAGPTGYHKSVVQLANGLHESGYPVAVMAFLGGGNVWERMLPSWPLDEAIPAYTVRSLPAEGGALLHRGVYPEYSGNLGALRFSFTANQVAVLRQLNDVLDEDDTIVFTNPAQVLAFQYALGDAKRRPHTILQIHGDYAHHRELWEPLKSVRGSIDRLQTVADGLRAQFIDLFGESNVVFIPNFPGEGKTTVPRVSHEGVNIVLPASLQHRKNQLDAVRALAKIDDDSVRLNLWGSAHPLNPYVSAVRDEIARLGLNDRVNICGYGSEQDVYSEADIVLMTSLSEGFPYPLLESMSHSLPVVAYDFDFGAREAIEDGLSGFLIPMLDVDLLAQRLGELSADASMRERFGAAGRERYDQHFSQEAVGKRYQEFLGPHGRSIDLTAAFATNGEEPISTEQISHRVKWRGLSRYHQIRVSGDAPLHDVQIDNSERTSTPTVKHRASKRGRGAQAARETLIQFPAFGKEVISYAAAPGSQERHYLGHTTTRHELKVFGHLRRDADYTPVDTLHAAQGGAQHVSWSTTPKAFLSFLDKGAEAVSWKVRQVGTELHKHLQASRTKEQPAQAASFASPAVRNTATPNAPKSSVPAQSPEPEAQAHTTQSDGGLGQGLREFGKALGLSNKLVTSVSSVAKSYAGSGIALLRNAVAVKEPVAPHREIGTHPWFPVTGGTENFGTPVNTAGAVEVKAGTLTHAPSVLIRGEYDSVRLRDGLSTRTFSSPFTYGEFFDRLCEAEREYGLFDITTRDGDYVWELGRSALVIQLAEALGLWGAADAIGTPVKSAYDGPKRLTTAPHAKTVVFDYVRRGQSGYRTAPFINDDTLFVVQADANGYPGVEDSPLIYPFAEFDQWRRHWRQRWSHLRVPEVDARPFEEALSSALGMNVDLGDHLRNRLAKFQLERDFFTPVFERVKPDEVMIASSHWRAGIVNAAQRSGALVGDIQYALTSRYAPSFWFGGTPHYGASRFHAWSKMWAERTNVYDECVIVPREQSDFEAAKEAVGSAEPRWDVCVISQPRVLRRLLAFVKQIADERPELSIVVAPHPAQRAIIGKEIAAAGLEGRVDIASENTLITVSKSRMSVGTFSTSLWESAALGKPTFVIEVPGYEETLQDVESGLFRLAQSPADLVPFTVPESRHEIFG